MALTPAEAAELAQLEKQYATAPNSGGLTPEEAAELAALEQQYAPPKEEPGLLKKGAMLTLDGVGRGLDYLAGNLRTGAFEAADVVRMIQGQPRIISDEDTLNALKGKAITSDEYMDRLGVPEGYSMSDAISGMYNETGNGLKLQKGGWADPSVRGAVGFATDTGLDPLTYATLGTSAAAKLALKGAKATPVKKALAPIATLSEYFGTGMYKSGLKKIDQEVAKYGKEPVSDVLMDAGISGDARQIYNQMNDLGEKFATERNQVLKEATRAGGEVSMREAMAPTLQRVETLRKNGDPKLQALADALEIEANKYLKLDPKVPQPTISQLPYTEKMGGQTPISFTPKSSTISGQPSVLVDMTQATGVTSKKRVPSTMISEVIPSQRVIGATVPDMVVPQNSVPFNDFTNPAMGGDAGIQHVDVTGVSPVRGTGYKTTMGAQLPDAAYKEAGMVDAVASANREMQGATRQAVENSVDRATGRGGELKELNDKLGRILTSKEKQLADAARQEGKDAVTQIDAMAFWADPMLYLAKQAGKATQFTGTRTRGGKAMRDFGINSKGVPDVLARRAFWEMINDQEKEQNQTPVR